MKSSAEQSALEIEAQLEEYPEERGEILLEAGQAWLQADQPDRALKLWAEAADLGGDDGCYARCELADFHMGRDESAAAYEQLGKLARDPSLNDGHCTLVAELLEEYGDLQGAATWYDRGAARIVLEDLEDGRNLGAMSMLSDRRQLRQSLGLPPDAADDLAERLPNPWLGQGLPTSLEEIDDFIDVGIMPSEVRLLTFQRRERLQAQLRWPGDYEQSNEEYYEAAELRWRELADSGAHKIRLIPASIEQLCEYALSVGGSPLDSDVKAGYARAVDESEIIAWPPERNGRCWCGSDLKYKKCCLKFR